MEQPTNTPYSTTIPNLSDLPNYIGKELGLTEWMTIAQERINQFANATGDEFDLWPRGPDRRHGNASLRYV